MKSLFDSTALKTSKLVTCQYSTSFSMGIKLLGRKIQPKIYAIYGFVRYADEIVDSFFDYDQEAMLNRFIEDYHLALEQQISINPILNSFQKVVLEYDLQDLVDAFLESMKADLYKTQYQTQEEYEKYIYGSADVVGLMCLKVFVEGNNEKYEELKPYAMKLGSAFQKVNFLRDLQNDYELLGRMYFPNVAFDNFNEESKTEIVQDIKNDFKEALIGIEKLPTSSRLGVLLAYKYYRQLLKKLERKSIVRLQTERIRIPNYFKGYIFVKALVRDKTNWI